MKNENKLEGRLIYLPKKTFKALDYLANQKDSKGAYHPVNEIILASVNLFLMGIQTRADELKKN